MPFFAATLGLMPPSNRRCSTALASVAGWVELIEQTVPPGIRLNRPLDLLAALDEEAALAKLRGYAEQNQVWTSLIGMGYHGTLTPARHPAQRPGKSRLVHRVHALSSRKLPKAGWKRC